MLFDIIRHDLRYSVRMLASHRASAGLSVLCLSLAIGTNTTVFTFVNALLLRPVPLAASEQLVSLSEARRADPQTAGPVSYLNFLDWKARVSDLAELAALRPVNLRVSDGAVTERFGGALASWNLFRMLGVQPAIGRGFREDDDERNAPVVLLSHGLWQERYGGDPAVLGRWITVDGTPRTVVGIMPAELSHFGLPARIRTPRLWIPIASTEQNSARDRRRLTVLGRLGPGVTPEMARARFLGVAQALETLHPADNAGWGISVAPIDVGFSSNTRAMLLLMMGAVTFVLLIACANVANLTLARTTSRGHEIATRLALGAPRHRIVRQLLTESVLVALASAPPGIALTWLGRDLMLGSNATPDLLASFAIDTGILIYTLGLAALASIVSGLVPALHAVRRIRQDALRAGGRRAATSGPPHQRLSHALIVSEVALSSILLVGASLFLQSFRAALRAEGGFDTSHILNVRVQVAGDDGDLPASASLRVGELVARLRVLPGVTNVAAANFLPLRNSGGRTAVETDGLRASSDKPPTVLIGGVTADFFGVLNVPVVQGRTFTDAEGRSRSGVAIVNRTMARRLWPNESVVGRRFRPEADGETWFTIIGVSDDILTWDLSNRPQPTAYVPYPHVPVREPGFYFRASDDPSLLASPARAAIQAVDPALTVLNVQTMTDVHYSALTRNQTLASVFAVVGGVALLLGAAGVYGVLSYVVSLRTPEIGIRAALGADRRTIIRLFVRQGMTVAFIGVAIGLAGAVALADVVRGRLHEVSPTDPWTFAGVALLVLGVGFIATYVPARRAAGVDPLTAIRE